MVTQHKSNSDFMNIDCLNDLNIEYLLQGRYEKTYIDKNFSPELRSPGFTFNILNSLRLLHRPIVDEIAISNGRERDLN